MGLFGKVLKVLNLRRCVGFGLGEGHQSTNILKPEVQKLIPGIEHLMGSAFRTLVIWIHFPKPKANTSPELLNF